MSIIFNVRNEVYNVNLQKINQCNYTIQNYFLTRKHKLHKFMFHNFFLLKIKRDFYGFITFFWDIPLHLYAQLFLCGFSFVYIFIKIKQSNMKIGVAHCDNNPNKSLKLLSKEFLSYLKKCDFLGLF